MDILQEGLKFISKLIHIVLYFRLVSLGCLTFFENKLNGLGIDPNYYFPKALHKA